MNGVVAWCAGVEGGKLKAGGSAGGGKRVKTTQEDVDVVVRKGKQVGGDALGGAGRKERKEKLVVPGRVDVEEEDDLAAQNAAADAAGWESGSVDGFSDDDDEDMDDSDGDSDVIREEDYASVSPGPSNSAPKGTKGKEKPMTTGSSSLFLPTLSSGFTMGDYDSDPDEDERRDKKSGKGGLVQSVRKNRRGQAERRK